MKHLLLILYWPNPDSYSTVGSADFASLIILAVHALEITPSLFLTATGTILLISANSGIFNFGNSTAGGTPTPQREQTHQPQLGNIGTVGKLRWDIIYMS
jgi:hypothetical protein